MNQPTVIYQVEQTKQSSINVVLIRHGESLFNQATQKFQNQYQQNINSELAKRLFHMNKELIDSPLTSKGREQSTNVQTKIETEKIQVVFVSPMKRALQTAQLIFKGREVKFVVVPELTEILSKICDISSSIEQKTIEFPKMDFSQLKGRQKFWQINMLSQSQKQISKAMIGEEPSTESVTEHLYQLLQQYFPNSMELRSDCTLRSRNALSIISQLTKSMGASKIAIVAHRRVLIEMTKSSQLPEGYPMKNCQSKTILIL